MKEFVLSEGFIVEYGNFLEFPIRKLIPFSAFLQKMKELHVCLLQAIKTVSKKWINQVP